MFQDNIEYLQTMNNNMKTIELSLEQAKEMHKIASDDMKIMLESNFPILKVKKFPKSHEELLEIIGEDTSIYYINSGSAIKKTEINSKFLLENRNIILTRERAEEILAFIQVMALYDQWCIDDNNYKFTYNSDTIKYNIYVDNNGLGISLNWIATQCLNFRTKELAQDFIDAHKDLLNQCKNLI